MLAKNNVILNYSDSKDPAVIEYLSKVKEVKEKHKFPLVFRTSYEVQLNASGRNEPFKGISIPLTANHTNNQGIREHWRYSKGYPNNGRYQKSRLNITKSYSVNEHDMELAVFLLYYSDMVKDGTIVLVNKQKEAQKKINAKKFMAQTNFLLLDEDSPIYNEDERLRTIALSFGIPRAGNPEVSLEEVKLLLISVIENAESEGDKERNQKAFVNALDMDSIVKEKAFVQKAIDLGIIRYREASNQWVLINGKGEQAEKICVVSPMEINKKEEKLIYALRNNPFYKDAVETRLEQGEVFGDNEEITEEWIEKSLRPQLLQKCKSLGIENPMQYKNEELKERMKEALTKKE